MYEGTRAKNVNGKNFYIYTLYYIYGIVMYIEQHAPTCKHAHTHASVVRCVGRNFQMGVSNFVLSHYSSACRHGLHMIIVPSAAILTAGSAPHCPPGIAH